MTHITPFCRATLSSLMLFALFITAQATAEEQAPESEDAVAEGSTMARELAGAKGFFALPLELDMDSGADNGDAYILRIAPVTTITLGENTRLVNITTFSIADAPGTPLFPSEGIEEKAAGVSDILHVSLVTPEYEGNFDVGLGVIAGIPTASDDALGSGRWSVGPALRITYRTGEWDLGLLAGQRWSFTGKNNRDDVDQLVIRGAIRRQLGDRWFLVSSPLITANWGTPGEDWLVPVGGGIGRRFSMQGNPWSWSLQGYANVIKPDAAPDWVFRMSLIAAVPFFN